MTEVSVKKRQSNIEWLRVVAMLMVVTLHALNKGGLLDEGAYSKVAGNWTLAWFIESFAIVAVNLYVLITGYCMMESTFKSGRLLNLILEVIFYSFGGYVIFGALGLSEKTDFYTLLSCVLPVHMDTYWFMTSYVVLYLFIPLLGRALKGIGKKQLGCVIVFLLIYECVLKSVLPFAMGIEDDGYSALWFVILFLSAAYLKKFGFGFLSKKMVAFSIYVACALLIFLEGYAINYVSVNFGHLELLTTISYDYNHLFVYVGSIGLFTFGMNCASQDNLWGRLGCFLGKYTLGVYLLHENPVIRYEWTKWFGLNSLQSATSLMFLLRVAVAVICVFTVGIIIDCVRHWLFKAVSSMKIMAPIKNCMCKMDSGINGTEDI